MKKESLHKANTLPTRRTPVNTCHLSNPSRHPLPDTPDTEEPKEEEGRERQTRPQCAFHTQGTRVQEGTQFQAMLPYEVVLQARGPKVESHRERFQIS